MKFGLKNSFCKRLFLAKLFFAFSSFLFSERTLPQQIAPGKIELPYTHRAEVEFYRKRYLSFNGRMELSQILENGERYRHYIRRRIIEEKMPACIEYIPVIESSYRAEASPKDGRSLGLWQFLENSIKNYLKKDSWIDERLDPWKSTDAALKKLKANYDVFGDWLLSIAAYNCGVGEVRRALAKTQEKTFWALCEKRLIPQHAINYVPHLIAISDVVMNSSRYGISFPEIAFSMEAYSPFCDFDYVKVRQMVSLKWLALELRIDEAILSYLNPALLNGVTPPNDEYEIRLPTGMGEAAKRAIF